MEETISANIQQHGLEVVANEALRSIKEELVKIGVAPSEGPSLIHVPMKATKIFFQSPLRSLREEYIDFLSFHVARKIQECGLGNLDDAKRLGFKKTAYQSCPESGLEVLAAFYEPQPDDIEDGEEMLVFYYGMRVPVAQLASA